ncbi:hypothetical protein [Pseudonocardia broussonetiae]|uniref:Uncharacterized protein n=1 Tax=Pseudonocardia broussonetiae TaxID=2736640 RepID=A0A6M6JGN3_9PSEU|nr:hypothetical protein [Pseudonocardia broussonetiae]QJY45872.1 hypothetical protein HOP40_08705 [Pseudonocardia broussonetiae]
MTHGDADDDARVPRPRSGGLADAVPITSRGASRSRSGGTAVLDGLAPPWLRMPTAGSARPSSHPQVRPVTLLASRRAAAVTAAVTAPEPAPVPLGARPRIVEEPSILGLSRRTRSRIGSRLFTLFFVAVFTLIAVQMVVEILSG